jgi:hypothetical protein
MTEISGESDEVQCEKLEFQARKIWIDKVIRDGVMRGQAVKTVRGFVRKGLSQRPLKLRFP